MEPLVTPHAGDTKDPRPEPSVLEVGHTVQPCSASPARPRRPSPLCAFKISTLSLADTISDWQQGSRVPAPPQSQSLPTPLLSSMASTFHAGSSSYPPPPTFSQESAETAMNGIGHSQSALNSFDGRQSLASTPTPTPPTSRHQQNGPYSMPTYAPMNGTYGQMATPKRLSQQQHYIPVQKPEIYTV